MYSYSKNIKQSSHWFITVLKYSQIHVITSSLISAQFYYQKFSMSLCFWGSFQPLTYVFYSIKCRLPSQFCGFLVCFLSTDFKGSKVQKGKSLSHVQLFATPWSLALQGSLPIGFSRQKCWSVQPSLLQGIFLTQGWNMNIPHCRQILYHLNISFKVILSLSF